MIRTVPLAVALVLMLSACGEEAPMEVETNALEVAEPLASHSGSHGLVHTTFPDEDPGPPFYARVTTIMNQFYHDGEWLVVPFHRDPGCVPEDFNLLAFFDPPGPAGPGAFACPLTVNGFMLLEAGAPPGTFPHYVEITGSAVPFYFVPWAEFQAEAEDGVVTITDLEALDPILGTAHRYRETLKPRLDNHLVVMTAAGTLEDGRAFEFSATHRMDRTTALRLRFVD